jgi:hypothetical protein
VIGRRARRREHYLTLMFWVRLVSPCQLSLTWPLDGNVILMSK